MMSTPTERGAGPVLDDPGVFRGFYDEALPRVYSYFFHRLSGSRAAAEDLTQETFLAAVAEVKRGTAVGDALPWVLGVARHKLLDHYRRQERDERKIAAVVLAKRTDARALRWDGEGSRERALAALASVAASQRAALVLRYLDGLSVGETAKALDKTLEATESLLSRGRESFKRSYAERDDA